MNVDLETQKAIRARLISTSAVTALVPANHILDVNQRPAPDPSIIMGDSQQVDEGTSLKRRHSRIFHSLHIWKREPSLEGVKTIAGAIRNAIHAGRLAMPGGLACADLLVSSTRFVRDPDGETSHGIVVIEALIAEVTP